MTTEYAGNEHSRTAGLGSPAYYAKPYDDFTHDIYLLSDYTRLAGGTLGPFTIQEESDDGNTPSNYRFNVEANDPNDDQDHEDDLRMELGTYTGERLAELLTEAWANNTDNAADDFYVTYNDTDGIVLHGYRTLSIDTSDENDGWADLGFSTTTAIAGNPDGQRPRFVVVEPAASGTNLLVVETEGQEATFHIDKLQMLPLRIEVIKNTTTVAKVATFW